MPSDYTTNHESVHMNEEIAQDFQFSLNPRGLSAPQIKLELVLSVRGAGAAYRGG